jgi:hypothetical protein
MAATIIAAAAGGGGAITRAIAAAGTGAELARFILVAGAGGDAPVSKASCGEFDAGRKHTESAGFRPSPSRNLSALEALRPQLSSYQELPADPRRRRLKPGQWWALFFDEFTEEGKRARADRAVLETQKSAKP